MNYMKIINDPSELRIGDEIITNAGSELRYYRIMEVPRISKVSPYKWGDKRARYIAVRCQTAVELKSASGIHAWNNKPFTRNWKEFTFKVPSKDDKIIKIDLNYKNIVIIKREEE